MTDVLQALHNNQTMKTASLAALLIAYSQFSGYSQESKTNEAPTANVTNGSPSIQEKYRDIEEEDGFRFFNLGQITGLAGELASGTLEKFGVVDSDGKVVELELVDKTFTNGHIKTKMLGDILVSNSERVFGDNGNLVRAGAISYAATETQIKKIHELLAARAKTTTTPSK